MIKDPTKPLIENVVTICGLGSSIKAVTSFFAYSGFWCLHSPSYWGGTCSQVALTDSCELKLFNVGMWSDKGNLELAATWTEEGVSG